MQFFPVSCYFAPPRPKYLPDHPSPELPSLYSSLNTREQVLQMCKTTGIIVVTQAVMTYDIKCRYICAYYLRKNGR